MKAILIFLAGLLFPITFLFGQSAIQKYAGTAMPYPFIKNLSVLNHDGMVPFYINHLGRHGTRFPTSGRALEKVRNVLILAEQTMGRIVGSRRAGTKGDSRAYAIALS